MSEDQPAGMSTTKILVIVLLAVGVPALGLVCCCGGLGIWSLLALKDLPAAQAAASTFLQGLSDNQIDATYQTTSASLKTTTSLAQFRAYVARFPVLKSPAGISFSGSQMTTLPQGTRATFKAVVTNPDNTSTITCTVTLVKENGAWKVEGLTVP